MKNAADKATISAMYRSSCVYNGAPTCTWCKYVHCLHIRKVPLNCYKMFGLPAGRPQCRDIINLSIRHLSSFQVGTAISLTVTVGSLKRSVNFKKEKTASLMHLLVFSDKHVTYSNRRMADCFILVPLHRPHRA